MLDQGVAQSTELVFKDDDSVYKLAEKHERLLLIYEEIVYDVTEFSDRHPGGYDIIEHYSGQDITEEFHDPKIHKHTKSALNQLMQFRIGKIDDDEFQVKNKQKEVLTQYLIDYQEFQLDRSKPLLNQIEKLTPEQFALMKKQDIVYYPFSENPKNFIQFEETPVKDQELWYKRNNLGDLELILGVIGLIIVLIQQREWLSLGISIASVFVDWRKILKCITFSKRSSQFRFMQQLIPIKSYVTRNQCLAEICLVLLYTLPYTNIYATIQLFIMGFKHKQLYDLPDSEFLKM